MAPKIINRRGFCGGLGAGLSTLITFQETFAQPWKVFEKKQDSNNNLLGITRFHISKHEDTLLDLARINKLGFVEIVAANKGIDPWLPGPGKKITLPTAHLIPDGPRKGILLNLVDQRLYYFPKNSKQVKSFPIGTGQDAWSTPLGSTQVIRKKKNPIWFVPKSIRKEQPELPEIILPGPDNPLGQHALYLGWQSYLIHGTNIPWGVGRRVSHGCIRMYPEDISWLFSRVPIGTPVTVVNQELKLGWVDNQLFIEVHPNPKQNEELERTGKFRSAKVPEMTYRIAHAAGGRVKQVDWKKVKIAALERTGLPVAVLKNRH